MKRYDAVFFDFDGILLDSGNDGFDWAHRVRERKAREFGHEVEGSELQFIFFADSVEELKELVRDSDLTWEQYREVEEAVSRRKAEMVRGGDMHLFPGARDTLKKIDLPKALISNAYGEAVGEIIDYLDIEKYFDYWDAPRAARMERYPERMKPSPVMLEEAIEELGCDNPVMIGDSEFDVKAANNAGMDSVLLDRYGFGNGAESAYTISSLEEFRAIVNGS